ncbi:Cuticle protein, partial [Danaus plexippus plexippus]|jgi:hypothetical protein
MKSSI